MLSNRFRMMYPSECVLIDRTLPRKLRIKMESAMNSAITMIVEVSIVNTRTTIINHVGYSPAGTSTNLE